MHEYTTGTYTKKLLFVDDVYQEYLKDNDTLKHPENKIYLAPPEYFLPTYDPAVYSIMNVSRAQLFRIISGLQRARTPFPFNFLPPAN